MLLRSWRAEGNGEITQESSSCPLHGALDGSTISMKQVIVFYVGFLDDCLLSVARSGDSKLERGHRNSYLAIRRLLNGEINFLRGLCVANGHRHGAATF